MDRSAAALACCATMDVRKRFGTNVRRLRKQLGLSQEVFALEAGIDRTYVSGVERGARKPSLTLARRFADGLGVPLWLVFTDDPESSGH